MRGVALSTAEIMKVVIIGNGKVGSNLSAQLVSEGHDVTVVDTRASALEKSKNTQDILCIEGNGATAEVQLEAAVNKAGLLVATTPYDELNMLCCLIAKKLGAKKTISRVRNPEYFKQTELIREDLGLSMIINPERTTADEIFRVLVFPGVLETFASPFRLSIVLMKLLFPTLDLPAKQISGKDS